MQQARVRRAICHQRLVLTSKGWSGKAPRQLIKRVPQTGGAIPRKRIGTRDGLNGDTREAEAAVHACLASASFGTPLGKSTSQDRAVGQLLEDEGQDPKVLEAKGIKLVNPRGVNPCGKEGRILFLAPDVVRQGLLRGTRWSESRIDQLLARLPGAKHEQQRCAGQRSWGISLPWASRARREEHATLRIYLCKAARHVGNWLVGPRGVPQKTYAPHDLARGNSAGGNEGNCPHPAPRFQL